MQATLNLPFISRLPADQALVDRRELIGWAEPVIADIVTDRYRRFVRIGHQFGMAVQHRQVWRGAILDQSDNAIMSRQELMRMSQAADVSTDIVDGIDQDVIEKLLEIVLARYQASRTTSKRFSLILMQVAACLVAARHTS